MKKQLILLTILFSLSLVTGVVAQENPEEQAKKFGVTFPVAELGNCASFTACHTYCDYAAHREACIGFAKKKGFYNQVENDSKRQAMMQTARTELGCDSEESCRTICSQEANFPKCQSFAQKNSLGEGPKPGDQQVLQKAKTILGCDSPESCKSVCEQEANREKCSNFAQQTGLGGGIKRTGPGGCNSEESCRTFCDKNPDECRKFGGGPAGEGQRPGPGGCNSEESCRAYCEKNPQECQQSGAGPQGQNGQPNRIGAPGGCTSEESCKKYCEEHPQECGGTDREGQNMKRPSGQPGPSNDFCRTNPEACKRPDDSQNRPPEQNFDQPPDGRFQEGKQGDDFRPPEGEFREMEQREEFRPPEQNFDQPPEGQQPPPDGQQQPPPDVRGITTTFSFFQQIFGLLFKSR